MAEQLDNDEAKTAVRRLQYALVRRLDIWKQVVQQRSQPMAVATDELLAADHSGLLECTAELRRIFSGALEGAAWQEYLLIEKVEAAARPDATPDVRKRIAQEVLGRLRGGPMTSGQQEFLAQRPVSLLARHLTRWAGESVVISDVLAHLEQFEETGAISDAAKMASDVQRLRWSSSSEYQDLADHLDEHYRNANIRLAVSSELVNRLLPQPEAREMPVRDQIMGANVRGRSTTITKLFVRLLPDQSHLRLGLEARGRVLSSTASTSGPATFYDAGESTFLARKDFVFGHRGLQILPAQSQAENQYSSLLGVETSYDQIPLIGSIVRNIARSEHDNAQGQRGK